MSTQDEQELRLYDEATRTEVYSDGVKASLALLWLSYSAELRAVCSNIPDTLYTISTLVFNLFA